MQKRQFILWFVLCFGVVTVSLGQRSRLNARNGVGLGGGLTQFDITTDNFTTKSGNGYIGGLIATVDIPKKWFNMSYGFYVSQNAFEISGRSTVIDREQTQMEYELMAVQLSLMLHIKIISDYLTIDLGPQIQYNGSLELTDESQGGFIVDGFDTLLAEDITNISQFNASGVVGASIGTRRVKLRASYSYGFTNILDKLNKENLTTTPASEKFKGTQKMIALSVLVVF